MIVTMEIGTYRNKSIASTLVEISVPVHPELTPGTDIEYVQNYKLLTAIKKICKNCVIL